MDEGPTFWSEFEEPAQGSRDDIYLKTFTKSREDDHANSSSTGRKLFCQAKTSTRVREEQDQDNADVFAPRKRVGGGLKTITAVREEDDQDCSGLSTASLAWGRSTDA